MADRLEAVIDCGMHLLKAQQWVWVLRLVLPTLVTARVGLLVKITLQEQLHWQSWQALSQRLGIQQILTSIAVANSFLNITIRRCASSMYSCGTC